MIRNLILMVCFVSGVSAFAQEKQKTAPAETPAKAEAPQQEVTRDDMIADGLILGLTYENLDSRATIKYKDSDSTYTYKSEKDLGFAGVRLGYGSMPVRGWGYNGIFTFEPSVKKDNAGQNYSIYKLEGNVSISTSLTEEIALYGFGGFHIADVTNSGDVEPFGFGLQLGAGLSFTANWAVELGYTITVHRFKDEFYDQNSNLDKDGSSATNGGWLVHLNYNF